jgi:uncharacterized membrane protein YdbT with pleckstrin-like domain
LGQHSCVFFRNLFKQTFQAVGRSADFVGELLVVAHGGGELLAQLLVVLAQSLAQLDELVELALERFEFRVHRHTIVSKILLSQLLTAIFECCLASKR